VDKKVVEAHEKNGDMGSANTFDKDIHREGMATTKAPYNNCLIIE
jgi:hypothetical protein